MVTDTKINNILHNMPVKDFININFGETGYIAYKYEAKYYFT